MPHEFTPREDAPEPQTSAARTGGRPPGKRVATDLLEPSAASEADTAPSRLHVFLMVVVLGLAATLLLWLLFF